MRIILLIIKLNNHNERIYKRSLPRALYKLNINNTQRDCN